MEAGRSRIIGDMKLPKTAKPASKVPGSYPNFFLVDLQTGTLVRLPYLDHETALALTSRSSTDILSKDLDKWVTSAKHMSSFRLNNRERVVALDLKQIDNPPRLDLVYLERKEGEWVPADLERQNIYGVESEEFAIDVKYGSAASQRFEGEAAETMVEFLRNVVKSGQMNLGTVNSRPADPATFVDRTLCFQDAPAMEM